MTGRIPSQVDKCLSWARLPASSSRDQHNPVHDPFVSTIPNFSGDSSRSTQPQFAFGSPGSQSKRGFGLLTGVPRAPKILIDDFNKEAYTIMTSEPGGGDFRPMTMSRSPTLTLTQDAAELGDFSFYGAFEEDPTTSPALDGSRRFSRTDLGIPSSQPLSRNGSQASSRLQDDTVSLALSNASCDDFGFLGPNYFTPGTSFSQDHTSMGAVAQFPGTSPVDNCQWQSYHSDLAPPASNSPSMDLSTSCDIDLTFSTASTDLSDIPRSEPRRMPQQSALSQSLQSMASSPAPKLPEPNLPPDPWNFDLLASGEEALSASFAWMDSQRSEDGLMQDTGFTNINVTPAHPMDTLSAGDFFGTSPGDFHPHHDHMPYTLSASRSFPAPQRQSNDDHLAVPLAIGRRQRKPRAYSASAPRPPSVASASRANTSSKPIPIPRRPQPTRNSQPRSLPGSISHSSSRGKRKGPMQETARQSAKKTRNEKTICIRCKGSKQGCHRPEDQPDAPCDNCEKLANGPKWPGPCTKAYFEDLVLGGSLNVKYHRGLTHLTADRQRRIHKALAPEFNLDNFLRLLDHARGRFNLRVYHGEKRVYGLNLDTFFNYLKKVNSQLLSREESESEFSGFLDKDLVLVDSKTDDWISTLTEVSPNPREDIVDLYLAMSSMPEHATFYYTSKAAHGSTLQERMIDPLNPAEEGFLQLAAQLARIIYRKVEINAMVQLQKDLHDILLNQSPQHQLVKSLHRLGCVLVSLRAHVAQSPALMGVPMGTTQHMAPSTECRVTELCRVLYFYYHAFRRRLISPMSSAWEDTLKGTWTRAVPSEPVMHSSSSSSSSFSYSPSLISLGLAEAGSIASGVWNMFPVQGSESAVGFEAWMAMAPAGSSAFL